MAMNYKKLFNELKKTVPLLIDDKYSNFDLIQNYEISNAIEFESIIRIVEVELLIEDMENEIFTEKDRVKILKLSKRERKEIEEFYKDKLKRIETNDLFIDINNPYFKNSYEKDLSTFGKLYNRPLEEFYKNKYEMIQNYYEINKCRIDNILLKYGLQFNSLICKIYNIYNYSNSYYERNFYNKYHYSTIFTKNIIHCFEESNVKIDDNNKSYFYYSRPILKKNESYTVSLELDINLPLAELINKVTALKTHFEVIYCHQTFNNMKFKEETIKNNQIKNNMQNNIQKAKTQYYIIDCYKIIKKKYNKFSNSKIFELLKEIAIENNYQLDINDNSSFNKLIKKFF